MISIAKSSSGNFVFQLIFSNNFVYFFNFLIHAN
jgi:hypothetical protein